MSPQPLHDRRGRVAIIRGVFATLGWYQYLQYFLLVLSLLVTLATLAALTLTGDRRQIVGANDNHIFKIVQSAHYVMWEVLFDPNAAAKNVIFHLKPSSYRDIQSRTVTNKYIALSLLEAVLNSTLPLYNSTATVQPLWDTLQHRWQQTRILVLR